MRARRAGGRDRKRIAPRGLEPFLIVASAGTTNTGAVDPLPELADLARATASGCTSTRAYGGFFLLTERGRAALAGIERADSVVLDPHKGLFLPYGTGCLLVRDGAALRARPQRARPTTCRRCQEADDLVDFCEHLPGAVPPLPRAARLAAAQAARRRRLPRGPRREARPWRAGRPSELRAMPGIEILAEPAALARRLPPAARPGIDEAALNELNRRFLAAINRRNRVYLTATMLGDRFALRICVLSFRTHMDRMEAGLEDLRAAAAEVA